MFCKLKNVVSLLRVIVTLLSLRQFLSTAKGTCEVPFKDGTKFQKGITPFVVEIP